MAVACVALHRPVQQHLLRLLDAFKVAHRLHAELRRRILVADNAGAAEERVLGVEGSMPTTRPAICLPRVELQRRHGPHVRNTFFDALVQRI